MQSKVFGFKCKTPDCAGIIPLVAAVLTAFPKADSTVTATCRKCRKKHTYVKSDVIDTGGRVIVTETVVKRPPK